MSAAENGVLLHSVPSAEGITDQVVFRAEVRAVSFRSIPPDPDGAAQVIADGLLRNGATLYLSDVEGNRTHAQINPEKIPVTEKRGIRVAFANRVLEEIGKLGLSPNYLAIPRHPIISSPEAGTS